MAVASETNKLDDCAEGVIATNHGRKSFDSCVSPLSPFFRGKIYGRQVGSQENRLKYSVSSELCSLPINVIKSMPPPQLLVFYTMQFLC